MTPVETDTYSIDTDPVAARMRIGSLPVDFDLLAEMESQRGTIGSRRYNGNFVFRGFIR